MPDDQNNLAEPQWCGVPLSQTTAAHHAHMRRWINATLDRPAKTPEAERLHADARELAGMLSQLRAASKAFTPGKDCREDIQAAIAAVDAALGGANA